MLCCCYLCCSVYCLCVNVYCTTATGCQPNYSQQIYPKNFIQNDKELEVTGRIHLRPQLTYECKVNQSRYRPGVAQRVPGS